MKLSASTLAILKNYATISTSLLIKPGDILRTQDALNTIFAQAKLDEPFPVRLAIFDLNRFLGTISLFSDPDIQFGDKFLTICEGKTKTRFVYADETVVIAPTEKDPKPSDALIVYSVSQQNLNALQKAAGVMSFADISFQVKDGKKSIVVHDLANESSDEYRVDVQEDDADVKLSSASFDLKIEKMKLIPAAYKASIHTTPKGKLVMNFSNEKMSYWIMCSTSSKSE